MSFELAKLFFFFLLNRLFYIFYSSSKHVKYFEVEDKMRGQFCQFQ